MDDYVFEVHMKHRDSMTRQVAEAMLISEIEDKGVIQFFIDKSKRKACDKNVILSGKCKGLNRREEGFVKPRIPGNGRKHRNPGNS